MADHGAPDHEASGTSEASDRRHLAVLDRLADDARAAPARPAPTLARVQGRVAGRQRRRRSLAGVALVLPLLIVGLIWVRMARTADEGGSVRTTPPELPDGRVGPDLTTTSSPTLALGPVREAEVSLRVDPIADSPLAGRDAMASAWTGTELIVWGGSSTDGPGSRLFDDGAAYDPTTDTWRMLAPSPLAARERAAAAWSGTELYVWGGTPTRSGVGGLLDGAAYDPATDTWRAIASAPAGHDRSYGNAVWVQDRLVVGGGSRPTGPPTDLLVYDPATDAWTATEVAGEVATVVAAGDQVAVLQLSLAPSRGTLAATWFDPVAGSVRTGPIVDVAVPDHVGAVWTGDDLVVSATSSSGQVGLVATTGLGENGWRAQRQVPADVSLRWPRGIGFMPSPDLLAWTGDRVISYGTGGGQAAWYDPDSGVLTTGSVTEEDGGPCGYDGAIAWTGEEVLAWGGQSCWSDAKTAQTDAGARIRPAG